METMDEGEDIQVTSPTSLAHRNSSRSSVGLDRSSLLQPPSLRTTLSTGRSSLLSRPNSSHQFAASWAGTTKHSSIHSTNTSPYGNSLTDLPRPTSNPSMEAVNEITEPIEERASSTGSSIGPHERLASTSSASFAPSLSTTRSFISRRGGARKSILSLLKNEKEPTLVSEAESSPPITCEGFLTKRGHVFTNWKMRYFVLRGNVLEYFAGEDKGKRYGSVVVEKVAPWSGEAHGFMFFTSKQVPYYVYASSEAERNKWLQGLKEYYVEPEDVTCEGYLTRRGHLVPSQRFAYYVLNGTTLRHYADNAAYRENQSAIAEVEVKSVTSWDGEVNGLMFQTVTGNVFYAMADSAGEQQKWLASVKNVTGASTTGTSTGTTNTGTGAINTSTSTTTPEPISCTGYLTKQGHKRKSWKKRFFILRGSTLSYFNDYEVASSTKGKALAEVIVEDVQRWNGEPFGFMFMTSEQVPYYVYADNEQERTKWITALQKATSASQEAGVEKKKCPNCSAVLTGSRFCGACGFNLRGSTVQRHTLPHASRDTNVTMADAVNGVVRDEEDEEDDTPFDELEALSEGARTLLLAVMQTPEGVDIGGETGFPSRLTNTSNGRTTQPNRGTYTLEMDMAAAAARDAEYEAMRRDDEEESERKPMRSPVVTVKQPVHQDPPPPLPPANESPSEVKHVEEDSEDEEEAPLPSMRPSPPSPPTSAKRNARADAKGQRESRGKINFAVVENNDVKNSSFTSFGDSDEEVKPEPKPVPVVSTTTDHLTKGGVHMGGMGRRKTVGMLMMEDSSDEEDAHETNLPMKPPTALREEDDQREEKAVVQEVVTTSRKSSVDSLELDVTGIAVLEEMQKPRVEVRSSLRVSERSSKNDLYHYFERELNFTPVFVPSADAPVRCRLYSSMAYASAKNVILFLSDSGPLGMWRQDASDHTTTTDHKWSMLRYVSRAQEEGYGVFVCNPFTNNAVVYEAGGFEREVPIPHSSTPREHVLFVWEQYLSKIKGQVSVVAYGRGGVLMKSVVESFEASVREKIHRIAFIDSKHEIDPSESYNVRELVGSRSINWEASFEPQGGQVLDSQARVGCVCLSIGFMPANGQDIELSPLVLKHAEDCVFAFINANPEKTGMSAIVKWVRAELRKIKQGATNTRSRPNSNILVLGEADAEENSDVSTGTGGGDEGTQRPTTAESDGRQPGGKPAYYLPKSSPKQSKTPVGKGNRTSTGGDKKEQITVAKDFDLLQVVGQGGFGKVFLARKRTPPNEGECYAMKVLKKQHVISSNLVTTTMAERQILTEIRHPFIVRLHFAFQDASKLYLVMDYLSGGSLASHLRRRRKFPEDWARFYAAEIAAAIAHLHSVNIIYRDAKLENVLLDHDGHVRITDFGLSKVGVSDLKGATTFCGTAAYIAPELLKGNSYGKAADWWSFGILLYEMIGGKPPYYHRNRDIMFQTILKQEWVTFSPNFSDPAVSLIRGLLTRDPMMRLGSGPRGADEVLTHPFFESVSWPALLQRRLQPPFNPGVGKLDTHYAPRLNNNEITTGDREGSALTNARQNSDFDGFSFVGRPSLLPTENK